jgi:alpha-ketoglutarate-dependent 2,4-dichlorophenoxyacetate dioxygenase
MMPHATKSGFDYIRVKPLAPTFGAEVTGVDFSKPVPSKVFAEIHRAITQVS